MPLGGRVPFHLPSLECPDFGVWPVCVSLGWLHEDVVAVGKSRIFVNVEGSHIPTPELFLLITVRERDLG